MSRHSIHRRDGPRGVSWYAIVHLGKDDVTGKQLQKRMSAPTRKELERKISELVERTERGRPARDSNQLVKAFMADWLDAIAPTVKGSTMRTWRSRCDAWIVPQLGDRRLSSLKPADVNRLIATMMDAGRSRQAAHNVFSTLRSALNMAVKWGLLASNPCNGVRPPRVITEEMKTWSAAEARTAIAHSADDARMGAFWRLALTTGMRSGELVGLRWQDIDLERGLISVRQAIVRGEQGRYIVSTPKTARGRRAIAISPSDVAALRIHRKAQLQRRLGADTWNDSDLVFCDGKGDYLRSTPITRAFNRLIAEAGLPTIRIHDMRHTAATLMLASGEHPKIVSERLGHSSISITLDRYSHVSESMQRDAANRLEALLERAVND